MLINDKIWKLNYHGLFLVEIDDYIILYPDDITIPLFIIIPFILCGLITTLELGVAFIQAYVFFVLLCIYLNDGYELY